MHKSFYLLSVVAAASMGLACANQTDTNPPIASGPAANESCAAYVQRSSPGVTCSLIDAAHCQCYLTSAGPLPATPPPTSGGGTTAGGGGTTTGGGGTTIAGGGGTTPTTNPAGGTGSNLKTATLTFTGAPPYTTVQCVSGPCPTQASVMVEVAGYPQVPIVGEAATVRFELAAPGHKKATKDVRLMPGTNTIAVTLEPDGTVDLKQASVTFADAPQGTTVKCKGKICPDTNAHAITEELSFKLAETTEDNKVVFSFSAPGYRTTINVYEIKAGRQRVPVQMDQVMPDASGAAGGGARAGAGSNTRSAPTP